LYDELIESPFHALVRILAGELASVLHALE
jgi:hypothetical protein